MYYVYLLRDKRGKFYIGSSDDLVPRLKDHLHGKVYTTRRMKDPELVYYEAYSGRALAKERERKLKHFRHD